MLVNGVQIELISFQRTLPNESKPIQVRKTHELSQKPQEIFKQLLIT